MIAQQNIITVIVIIAITLLYIIYQLHKEVNKWKKIAIDFIERNSSFEMSIMELAMEISELELQIFVLKSKTSDNKFKIYREKESRVELNETIKKLEKILKKRNKTSTK